MSKIKCCVCGNIITSNVNIFTLPPYIYSNLYCDDKCKQNITNDIDYEKLPYGPLRKKLSILPVKFVPFVD